MPTTSSQNICRVAVVDDEDYDRERLAESLRTVGESYDIPKEIEIENFGNAHEVAARIKQNSSPRPLWDIVLADVLMPHPKTGQDEHENA